MAKKILIVEDDSLLVNMYKAKFESQGYEVTTANEGEAGLKAATGQAFDIILLDMMMPKVSGTEFLNQLKNKNIATPVLVLSNLSNEEQSKAALALGAKEYLVKASLTPSEVVAKVQNYL